MAISPLIPTSFVPHPENQQRKFTIDFMGVSFFIIYFIFFIVVSMSFGIFFYGKSLSREKISSDNILSQAEKTIDSKTIDSFSRLHNRLVVSKKLLNTHLAFSNFFTLLANDIPSTVRFKTLRLSFDKDNIPKVDGEGIAKNLNALAAVSSSLSKDGKIKDIIVSNITIAKDSSVAFTLTANLDPKSILFAI